MNVFDILFFLLLYTKIRIYCQSYSFCGSNFLPKKDPKKLLINSTKNFSQKRKISSTEYIPINIIIDKKYLSYQLQNHIINEDRYNLITEALDSAASILSSLISLEKDNYKFTLQKSLVLENCHLGENLYTESIFETDALSSNSIVIFPRFHFFKQSNPKDILSSASFCALDYGGRPLAGYIYIEGNMTDFEIRKNNADRYYTMIFLHELTHILIFDEQLLRMNNNFEFLENVTILNKNRILISSPKILSMARRHFGCENIRGIELENQEYDWLTNQIKIENMDTPMDKYKNHWDTRIMLTDYMTGTLYDESVISEITLALFEDSGFYKVNYFTGGLFRYGKNQGCEFLNSYCIYGDVSLHKNDFCITEGTTMCTPGRTHRAMCGVTSYPYDLKKEYRYFSDSRRGGHLPQADYCPVARTNSSMSRTYYYQGHCEYGEYEEYPRSLGYAMNNESICLLSSLTPKNIPELIEYPGNFRALCYKVECYENNDEKSVRIYIGNNVITCPTSGGQQTLEGYYGYILCPDYNLVCTGTEWCIDPIDCVDKQSEAKNESFYYNYKIATSQEYKSLINYKVSHEAKIEKGGYIDFSLKFIFFLFFTILL